MSDFKLPKGRARRNLKLSSLAASVSGRFAATKARAVAAGDEKKQELMEAFHLKSADEMVRAMGAMKGAVMKIGQMASFVTDDVPPAYQKILAKLQTQSDPMPYEQVRSLVEAELNAPIAELFESFAEEPLAAASVGQVHAATLPGGDEVVVKVQYPGVDAAIRSDLSNLSWTRPIFRIMSPAMDPDPLINELRTRLVEELDYTTEARNQNAFAALYEGHPYVHVPKARLSHCSARVLTSTRVHGHSYEWLLDQDDAHKQSAAEIMFRFVFSSIFEFHALNGDPHPGNYLFHEDGTVTFIDFGCVRYYAPDFVTLWKRLLLANMEGRDDDFLELTRDVGFFQGEITVPKALAVEFFGLFYEPFRRDREFVFTSEYTASTLSESFARDSRFRPLMKEVNMPAEFVFVNRIQWGLYAILTKLGSRGNFYRIFRESLSGASPANALGEANRAFRARWKDERDIPQSADVWMDAGELYWSQNPAVEKHRIAAG